MRVLREMSAGRKEALAGLVMAVFFLVGFAGHVFSVTLPLMMAITPFFLLIFGGAAFLPVAMEAERPLLLWCGATLAVTFALEVVGAATGLIFGPYTYGRTLGPQLFGVPLLIAFNWLIVIVAAIGAAQRAVRPVVTRVVLVGLIAVIFDYVLEPTAIVLSYWTWSTPVIPWQNYLAWFCIAAGSAAVFFSMRLEVRSRLPIYYVVVQLLFFLGLGLVPPGRF